MAKILVTGTAGFIGYHLANALLERGDEVVGIDNINDYYDPAIKFSRLNEAGIDEAEVSWGKAVTSKKYKLYRFIRLDLKEREKIKQIFEQEKFDIVVNLAAQAGVRYSLINPYAYIDSNILSFINILEACRHNHIRHLVYASSSSVYGLNEKMPLSEKDNVDHPVSLYAATKKSNELMAHTYSHLYGLPSTGLRFFTVYGPWGRPDMALFLFTDAILNDRPIKVFNYGDMVRDFTYIDDIVEGIIKVLDNAPVGNPDWSGMSPDPSTSLAPYQILNIGNNNPVKLMRFIEEIEKQLGKKAKKNLMEIQPGDVAITYANVQALREKYHYVPKTLIQTGIEEFLKWYKSFYDVS